MVENLVFHEHVNHIEVDCHSINGAYDDRLISLPHWKLSTFLLVT